MSRASSSLLGKKRKRPSQSEAMDLKVLSTPLFDHDDNTTYSFSFQSDNTVLVGGNKKIFKLEVDVPDDKEKEVTAKEASIIFQVDDNNQNHAPQAIYALCTRDNEIYCVSDQKLWSVQDGECKKIYGPDDIKLDETSIALTALGSPHEHTHVFTKHKPEPNKQIAVFTFPGNNIIFVDPADGLDTLVKSPSNQQESENNTDSFFCMASSGRFMYCLLENVYLWKFDLRTHAWTHFFSVPAKLKHEWMYICAGPNDSVLIGNPKEVLFVDADTTKIWTKTLGEREAGSFYSCIKHPTKDLLFFATADKKVMYCWADLTTLTVPDSCLSNIPEKSELPLDEALSRLLDDGSFSDITFRVGGDEGVEFQAHKSVLAARSKYFEKFFGSNFKDSSDEVILVDSASPDAFRIMLHFLYTNKLQLDLNEPDSSNDSAQSLSSESTSNQSNHATTSSSSSSSSSSSAGMNGHAGLHESSQYGSLQSELLVLADLYQVSGLIKLCRVQMAETLCIENVIDIAKCALKISDESLRRKTVEFMGRHWQDGRTHWHKRWPELPQDFFADVLDHVTRTSP